MQGVQGENNSVCDQVTGLFEVFEQGHDNQEVHSSLQERKCLCCCSIWTFLTGWRYVCMIMPIAKRTLVYYFTITSLQQEVKKIQSYLSLTSLVSALLAGFLYSMISCGGVLRPFIHRFYIAISVLVGGQKLLAFFIDKCKCQTICNCCCCCCCSKSMQIDHVRYKNQKQNLSQQSKQKHRKRDLFYQTFNFICDVSQIGLSASSIASVWVVAGITLTTLTDSTKIAPVAVTYIQTSRQEKRKYEEEKNNRLNDSKNGFMEGSGIQNKQSLDILMHEIVQQNETGEQEPEKLVKQQVSQSQQQEVKVEIGQIDQQANKQQYHKKQNQNSFQIEKAISQLQQCSDGQKLKQGNNEQLINQTENKEDLKQENQDEGKSLDQDTKSKDKQQQQKQDVQFYGISKQSMLLSKKQSSNMNENQQKKQHLIQIEHLNQEEERKKKVLEQEQIRAKKGLLKINEKESSEIEQNTNTRRGEQQKRNKNRNQKGHLNIVETLNDDDMEEIKISFQKNYTQSNQTQN